MGEHSGDELVEVGRVYGEAAANVYKGRLESEGIPVLLKYESLGNVLGVIIDGLGEFRLMVPSRFAEIARELISSQNDS
jgi:hypothetical protein